MAQITFENVDKRFENKAVIQQLNVTIRDGSFTVLLGPSGCGKTTTLRMIAGLEQPDEGRILLDGKDITNDRPGERDVAMVFQNYALYPTMTVYENIEFGLVNRKVPKKQRQEMVREIVETVGLQEYLHKKPHTLSGGQRQRVALARAMIKKPKVFLMDEPLSNLDAKLRNQLRTELVALHRQLGTTFVYVTHDQMEAMSMGDDIIIMNHGAIQQIGSPTNIYEFPVNLFTAQFIGSPPMNVFAANALVHSSGGANPQATYVGFRPEHASLSNAHERGGIVMDGIVVHRQELGPETALQIQTEHGVVQMRRFEPCGSLSATVRLYVGAEHLHYFDAQGRRLEVKYDALRNKQMAYRGG